MAPPQAILFDMDGTLTEPLLDFDRIRAEMGIAGRTPILEALAGMPPDRRHQAEQVLLGHERHAAEHAALNPGCRELLDLIDGRLRTALITRNSRASADTVCRLHGLRFDTLITREFGLFKPHPHPVLHACRALQVAPDQAWMVGDGQFDVEAGLAAGAHTIWLSRGRSRAFASAPHRTVLDLNELTNLLKDCLAC